MSSTDSSREHPSHRSENYPGKYKQIITGCGEAGTAVLRILAEHNYHIVDIMDFELKGSLFAVGVKDADPSIRIGDEAVVVCNGEVKAVGVAMMSGRYLS